MMGLTCSSVAADGQNPGTGNTSSVAHPSAYFETNPMPENYVAGTLDPQASYKDLIFIKPMPDPATLSHAERYIIAGLTKRPYGQGKMDPWREDLYHVVRSYYSKFKKMPSEMSDDVIKSIFREVTPQNWLPEFLHSPVTGRYPRLDAAEFSPGDVYMRPLNDEEIAHMCKYDSLLKEIVVDGKMGDQPVKLIGAVFYTRIYGEKGIIHAGLDYTFLPYTPAPAK